MRVLVLAAVLASVSAAVLHSPAAPLSTTPPMRRNATRVVAVSPRRLILRDAPKPATTCGANASSPCDTTNKWCCDESTECVQDSGAWMCEQRHDAMACGASDTPCHDGLSCCPEDSTCALEGGCVAEVEGECDSGETLCVGVCCTSEEQCDDKTGVCMAIQDTITTSSTVTQSGSSTTRSTLTAQSTTAATPSRSSPTSTGSASAAVVTGASISESSENGGYLRVRVHHDPTVTTALLLVVAVLVSQL